MGKNQAAQTVKTNSGHSSSALPPNLNEEVAKLAYQYYVDRGCEHGHDQEDWLRAESTLTRAKGR